MRSGRHRIRMRRRDGSLGLCRGLRLLFLRFTLCKTWSFSVVCVGAVLIDYSTLAAGALAMKLSVDAETVLFAVLDIFTQGLVGYWLLLAHDSSPGM